MKIKNNTKRKCKKGGILTRKVKLNPFEIKFNKCEKKNCPNSLEKEKKAYEKEYKKKCHPIDTLEKREEYRKCDNDLFNNSKYKKKLTKHRECIEKYCAEERIAKNNNISPFIPKTKEEKELYKLLRETIRKKTKSFFKT